MKHSPVSDEHRYGQHYRDDYALPAKYLNKGDEDSQEVFEARNKV